MYNICKGSKTTKRRIIMNIGDYWWLILGIVLIVILVVILIVLKVQLNRDQKLLDQNGAKNETSNEKQTKKTKEQVLDTKADEVVAQNSSNEESTQNENEQNSAPSKKDTSSESIDLDDIDFIPVESEPQSKKSKKKLNEEGTDDDATPNESEKVESTSTKKESGAKTVEKYRVTYDKDKQDWVVKKDGAQKANKRFATKEEATEYAKDLAKRNNASVVLHKKDGKFQKKH